MHASNKYVQEVKQRYREQRCHIRGINKVNDWQVKMQKSDNFYANAIRRP